VWTQIAPYGIGKSLLLSVRDLLLLVLSLEATKKFVSKEAQQYTLRCLDTHASVGAFLFTSPIKSLFRYKPSIHPILDGVLFTLFSEIFWRVLFPNFLRIVASAVVGKRNYATRRTVEWWLSKVPIYCFALAGLRDDYPTPFPLPSRDTAVSIEALLGAIFSFNWGYTFVSDLLCPLYELRGIAATLGARLAISVSLQAFKWIVEKI